MKSNGPLCMRVWNMKKLLLEPLSSLCYNCKVTGQNIQQCTDEFVVKFSGKLLVLFG